MKGRKKGKKRTKKEHLIKIEGELIREQEREYLGQR
jgi:hypothetical protein